MQGEDLNEPSHPETVEELSLRELLRELLDHLSKLVSEEVRLAKVDLQKSAKKGMAGALLAGAGGAIALVGFLILAFDAVYLLAFVMPLWVSALVIGGGLATVGGLLALGGLRNLKSAAEPPAQLAQDLEEDARWAKETMRDIA